MKRIIFFSVLIVSILLFPQCKGNKNTGNADLQVVAEIHTEDEHETESPAIEEEIQDINYSTIILEKKPFSLIVRTSGRIMVDSKDILVITAKASGIIKFTDHFLFPGVKINTGQDLFVISGGELSENNPEIILGQAKSDLDKATLNYERARKLITDQIITEAEYLDFKNEYEKSLIEYNNLNSGYSKDGSVIKAPAKGYIKEIFVTEGQKVAAGESITSIVIDHNLILKADISPDYLSILPEIEKANFTVGYSQTVFKTEDLNGEKISFGKSTGDNTFYIPVFFRMDYVPELIEGTFAEVYLIGKEIPDAISVPNTSIMEEYGKYYVFQLHEDGDFVKRYVTIGFNNGEYTQILTGLEGNETIVATGTYQVKLSQMSTTAPAHNH